MRTLKIIHRARSQTIVMMSAMLVAATLIPGRLVANALADDPMTVVKTTVNQALATLRDQSMPLAAKQDKLRQIVSATFNFKEMGKSAMGYHWKDLTPAQQDEFTQAFVAFIEDSYLGKINDYRGQDVAFLRARNDGPDYAQVNTDIVQPGKDPIHVNYRLVAQGDSWKIYDVTVDSISIIANYRNQFNRVMNNSGYNKLIADLKSKQAALAASLANH
jgi:phospholipid transport system substrate-binding protein